MTASQTKGCVERLASAPFLSSGHRPFFFMMAAYSTGAMGFWFLGFTGRVFVSPSWHGHEMIFGFAAAAMAGFLLTAVPNWTKRPPVRGAELLALVALWGLGRLSIDAGMWTWLDLVFLPVLGIRVLFDIAASRNWRNLLVPVIVFGLAGLNLMYHFGDPSHALLVSVYLITALIALIGGRIVPAFTANALNLGNAPSPAPRFRAFIEQLSVPSVLVLVIAELFYAPTGVTGALALITAAILLIRMTYWRTFGTFRNPLLWILHIGYFWIPAGYALKGLADLWGAFDPFAALHALTAGGIGVMILAVSTRAALGHAGRPLAATPATVMIYALVIAAALVRVFVPVDVRALEISGALWVLGFGLYAFAYWPVFTKPRMTPGRQNSA